MSAHTALNYASLLSPNWLGNFPEKSPFRIIRRSAPVGREGGDVIPGGWTPVDIGERAYIAGNTVRTYGGSQLQKDPGGDRIEKGITLILPKEILARIIIDENETDSDIIQFEGANYRCIFAQPPDNEQGLTAVTAVRIQPRNLPSDLPVFP